MSSANSPCAACKFLRRKCTQDCDFAPYFPSEHPQRFACVHGVFGAKNVAKLLKELSATQRDEAVKSLAYEAEARLKDPIYGCVGLISVLQQRLKLMQHELQNAKKELATYVNPQATQYLMENQGAVRMQPPQGNLLPNYPNNLPPQTVMPCGGQLAIHDSQGKGFLEAQQLAAAKQLQHYEQQQHFLRFNSGNGGVAVPVYADVDPSLALGTFDHSARGYQIQQQGEQQRHVSLPHAPVEEQLLLSRQQLSLITGTTTATSATVGNS